MSAVIERLINLLAFLIDSGRPVTAREVRRTVHGYGQSSDQAFHRMFERDKDTLRRLGVPLEMRATDVWEVEKGYVIPDEAYRTIDPKLTEEERTALGLAVHMVQTGDGPSGSDAMLKLGGARFAGGAAPVGADLAPEGGQLDAVFEAVFERRRLRFTYRGRRRTIEPYGMRHLRGRWYFAGAEEGRPAEETRTYRLDRAEGLAAAGPAGAFERPRRFVARDILSSLPWEAGDELTARVRCAPEAAWWAEFRFPGARAVEQDPEGWTVLDVPYWEEETFIDQILDFDDEAEVLAPPGLRRALISQVRGGA